MVKIIVKKEELLKLYSDVKLKSRIKKGIQELEVMKLLPLRTSNSLAFIQFIRTLGLRYSDGCIYKQKNNNSFTFYICFGKEIDASKLCEDIKNIWGINLMPHKNKDSTFNVYLLASIARLMVAVGSPIGDKTLKAFRLPNWIFELPDELKWEFIDGLFSGDGSAPRLKKSGCASESLKLSLNSEKLIVKEFAKGFMTDIRILLGKLGIKVSKPKIEWKRKIISKDGTVTYPVTIRILTEKQNMIKFLEKVRYCYNCHASKQRKIVLKGLKGETLIEELILFFKSDGKILPSNEIAILLEKNLQKELIERAACKVSSQARGKYTKLAKFLYNKTNNLRITLSSLRDNYLADWKNQKRFISLSYLKRLVELSGWQLKYVSNSIRKVRLLRNHNKFAISVNGIEI